MELLANLVPRGLGFVVIYPLPRLQVTCWYVLVRISWHEASTPAKPVTLFLSLMVGLMKNWKKMRKYGDKAPVHYSLLIFLWWYRGFG